MTLISAIRSSWTACRSSAPLLALLVTVFLGACATIPDDPDKPYQAHIPRSADSTLGVAATEVEAEYGQSVFYPLADGLAALGARLRLIEAAEESIDMQYFLMKGDSAGEVVAGALIRAADRGVRVRILLDDVFTSVKDAELSLLDAHPNIEVRLFNPVSRRFFYWLNYAGDYRRANRRMHSKSFTVDAAATIVGGRNIADEYFQINTKVKFLDFDVFVMGPVVSEVSNQFDDFWNAPQSIPVASIQNPASEDELNQARREINAEQLNNAESIYQAALNSEYMQELINGTGKVYAADARLLNDTSEKLSNPISEDYMHVVRELSEVIDEAEDSVVVITPYFVPRKTGIEYWQSVVDRGVKLTVVTNSLASNNHTPVHAAYSRYRKPMLEMGANLFEAKVKGIPTGSDEDEPEALTLHTKLLMIDSRYLFIGSLNLDPRSLDINAEMGLLVDSTELGILFDKGLAEVLDYESYRLTLDDRGKVRWSTVTDGKRVEFSKDPETSFWKRFSSGFYKILPESQL